MGDSTAVARVHSETAAADLSGVHSVLFLNGGGSLNTDELVVVMPTRIRMDSRVVLAHCTITWLSNSVFVLLLLAKLEGWATMSWWMVFLPFWIKHTLQVPLLLAQIYFRDWFMTRQIGPPPPPQAPPATRLQFNLFRQSQMQTYLIDIANTGFEGLGICGAKRLKGCAYVVLTLDSEHTRASGSIFGVFCAQILFVVNLEAVWRTGVAWISFRTILSPVWAAWFVITCMACFKNRHERIVGGARDLLFLFLLFVCFKLDNQSNYSWRLVFLIPWMWFSALFLLTTMVFVLLLLARVWTRLSELILPVGFFALLLSCIPQFISYISLVDKLDGDLDVSNQAILIPNAVSWFFMWITSLIVCWGLHKKEIDRASASSFGSWTARDQLPGQANYTQEAAQQQADNLTEMEIADLVEEMMEGKTKPAQLVKIGGALFRRISAHIGADDFNKMQKMAAVNTRTAETAQADPIPASTHKISLCVRESESLQKVSSVSMVSTSFGADGSKVEAGQMQASSNSLVCHSIPSGTPSDDGCCIICYDAVANCVFLECGHGGYCRKCANRLFVRPPNECPTCRQKIDQVVEVSVPGKIGEVLAIK